jgi:hypothetical protein
MGWYREKGVAPEFLHRLHQLYNGTEFGRDQESRGELAPVRRYAVEFNRKNRRPPDWIELVDLRRADEIEITIPGREIAGTSGQGESETEPDVTIKVRPWIWSDAIWHYNDGTNVVYRAYDKIDWENQ